MLLKKNDNRKTATVMPAIKDIIIKFPKKMRKMIIVDQCSEFANFKEIEQKTKCLTYYCDPHSRWQRGSNKNTNGRLRRFLLRSTDIKNFTQNELDKFSKKFNDMPRECLGFMTPKEALLLDCKSSCRSSY